MFRRGAIRSAARIGSLVIVVTLAGGLFEPVHAQSSITETWKQVWCAFDGEGCKETAKRNQDAEPSGSRELKGAPPDHTTTSEPKTARGWIESIWRFPILKTGKSWVRLNQLIAALGVLFFGWMLASLISRLLSRLLRRRKRIDQNAAIAFQKTLFYFFILLVLILAMQVADLPLEFLTVLGAALAIGVSIGAKNTIYDYLGGLILALEKPVRVGDCVEVENQCGFVTEIAGRYTIIRRFDGVNVLVPNSTLLEHNVINWTLRDQKIRGDIKIGVVYDSPVRKVAELIDQALDENQEVLESPSAGVRFWDFGESSLVFWAWFWTDSGSPLHVWRIQSELRFRIVELFRENGIGIAYPQRDVHLDAREPIAVQLSQAEAREGGQTEQSRQPEPDMREQRQRDEEAEQELVPDDPDTDSAAKQVQRKGEVA